MKNEYWEWFVGSTALSYDDGLSYNLDTNGEETFDHDGIIVDASVSKRVNGIRAKDYGPIPELQYNSKTDSYDVIPRDYHRFEVNGAMMPEVDLMLHEAYRYLEVLYPDHPDFIEILTNNEINDEITQAAALVHYIPDNTFFDWLASELDYDIDAAHLLTAQHQEAMKLKIRNLVNNAFRRKFYGAKSGYQQFGSEVFQHVLLFPVAKYMPFKTVAKGSQHILDAQGNIVHHEEAHKQTKWFSNIFLAPDDFKDRDVNRFDMLYNKPFRLVDWTNASYDYLNEYVPPTPIKATAWPTPYSMYDVYEYPAERSMYSRYTIQDDFFEGQKVWVNQDDTDEDDTYTDNPQNKYKQGKGQYINTMFSEDAFYNKVSLSYNEKTLELETSSDFMYTKPEYVTRVQLDGPVHPHYVPFEIYPNLQSVLEEVLKTNNRVYQSYITDQHPTWQKTLANIANFFTVGTEEQVWLKSKKLYDLREYQAILDGNEPDKMCRCMKILYGMLSGHIEAGFILEPHQDGSLHMAPEKMLTLLGDELNITKNRDDVDAPYLEYQNTAMPDDAFIKPQDILINDLEEGTYAAEVVGISRGHLNLEVTASDGFVSRTTMAGMPEEIYRFNDTEFAKNAVVVKLSANNVDSAGKLVVFFGKPTITKWHLDSRQGTIMIDEVDFLITAIPRIKSYQMLRCLYPDFLDLTEKKFAAMEVLLEKGKGVKEEAPYKVCYSRYEILQKTMPTLAIKIDELIATNYEKEVHPNDFYWKAIKALCVTIINTFNLPENAEKRRQLDIKYAEFVKTTDSAKTIADPPRFEKQCREWMVELNEYVDDYYKWMYQVIAVDLVREPYAKLDPNKLNNTQRYAYNDLVRMDKQLDEWMSNRGLLLSPLPTDIYMSEPDDLQKSYALLSRQDTFKTLLDVTLDDFNEDIRYNQLPQFGIDGWLNEWTFGSLDTVTVIQNDHDVDEIAWEFYETFPYRADAYQQKWGINFLKQYPVDLYTILVLNRDILDVYDNSHYDHRFSYATPEFLELFLPEELKWNFVSYIPTTYEVEIRSVFTEGNNVISFVDDESIFRSASISTGDQIIGNGIEDDIFVQFIDNEKNQIYVTRTNRKSNEADYLFTMTGDRVLTYLCRKNIYARDNSRDWWTYRWDLSKNKLIDSGSIFRHGVYRIDTSATSFSHYYHMYDSFLNGMIDADQFINTWKANIKKFSEFRAFFNKYVWHLHNSGRENESALTHYVVPSLINCVNSLYVDLNAYKLYEDDAYLMKIDVLDYFQNNVDDLSRGSDIVNVGPHITAGTVANATITMKPGEDYSDPAIKLRFMTDRDVWNMFTMPAYIDIGIGQLKDELFFYKKNVSETVEEDEDIEDNAYRPVYGEAVYDDIRMGKIPQIEHLIDVVRIPGEEGELITTKLNGNDVSGYVVSGFAVFMEYNDKRIMSYEDLEEEGISVEKAERTPWSAGGMDQAASPTTVISLDHIDKPIMRVYLGEYEVQRFIQFDDILKKKYTTVQFSVIKQVFKDLAKTNEDPLKITTQQFFVYEIFDNIRANWKTVTLPNEGEGSTTVSVITYKVDNTETITQDFKYEGEWRPAANDDRVLVYPKLTVKGNDDYSHYYSITRTYELSNVKLLDSDAYGTRKFGQGSVLVWDHNAKPKADPVLQWRMLNFKFFGMFGEPAFIKNNLVGDIDDMSNVEIKNSSLFVNAGMTLRRLLLIKAISSLNIIGTVQNEIDNFTEQELLNIYNYVVNKLPTGDASGVLMSKTDWDGFIESTDRDAQELAAIDDIYNNRVKDVPLKNKYNVTANTVLWFYYSGAYEYDEYTYADDTWAAFKSTKIPNGTGIALVPMYNKGEDTLDLKVLLLKETAMFFLIDHTNSTYSEINGEYVRTTSLITSNEYLTYIGRWGKWKANETFSSVNQSNIRIATTPLLPIDRINLYNNVVSVKYRNLLEGSVNTSFQVIPHFKTEGLRYLDDGITIDDEQTYEIDITEDNIYYDEANNCLYTYNTINSVMIKYKIIQENNRYFKNLLHLYGQYEAVNTQIAGDYVTIPNITPITGLKFDSDLVSLFDRILEIEQINIRSMYNPDLESTIFSSYCNIKGVFKGILLGKKDEAGHDIYPLDINYKDATNPTIVSNQLKFSTELKKILPIRDGVSWVENTLDFPNGSVWPDGYIIPTPEIKHYKVTYDLSEGGEMFTYYKNMLVLEGEVDIHDPGYIDFGKNSMLGDALNYARLSDEVVSIVALTDSTIRSYDKYTSVYPAKFIDYKLGKFLVAGNKEFSIHNLSTLEALALSPRVEPEKGYISGLYSELESGPSNSTLNSIAYYDKDQSWVFAVTDANSEMNMLYALDIEQYNNPELYRVMTPFGNEVGMNINTPDLVRFIDVNFDDDQYNISGQAQARDIAIISGKITEGKVDEWNLPLLEGAKVWTKMNAAKGEDAEYNMPNEFTFNATTGWTAPAAPVNLINRTGIEDGMWESVDITIPKNEYRILHFDFKKADSDLTANEGSVGAYKNVAQLWNWDRNLSKWVVVNNNLDFHNFVDCYKLKEDIHGMVYLCGCNYGAPGGYEANLLQNPNSQGNWGMQLWNLPLPETFENTSISAIVLDKDATTTKLEVRIDRVPLASNPKELDKGGKFILSNVAIVDKSVMSNKDNDYIREGVYDPSAVYTGQYRYVENVEDKLKAKKWAVSNGLDNMVVIIGNVIFVYSPIRTVDDNGGRGISQRFHWTRANLPTVFNTTYRLFDDFLGDTEVESNIDKGLEKAYNLVNDQYDITLAQWNIQAGPLLMPEELKIWLEKHPPQKYLTEESIPINIVENGIELCKSNYGKRVNVDPNRLEYWNSPEDVIFEMGLTTTVYLRRQMYLQYLSDYYQYILGSSRMETLYSPGVIKDVKLTNTSIIIHTRDDDILTLELRHTMTRAEIENYNNWHISNIDSDYMFNENNLNSVKDRYIGVGEKFLDYQSLGSQKPKKALHINQKYVDNNLQVYTGYIEAHDGVMYVYTTAKTAGKLETVEFLTELFPNNIISSPKDWQIFPNKRFPVIYYSENNGETFTRVPLPITLFLKGLKESQNSDPNIEAHQIYLRQGKIQVVFRQLMSDKSWEDMGYTTFTVNQQESNTTVSYDMNLIAYDDVTKTEIEEYMNLARDLSSVESNPVIYLQTADDATNVLSDPIINSFLIEQPYKFATNGIKKITAKDDQSVRYSPAPTAADATEYLRVLVAINPSVLLEKPTTYLNYKEEYINNEGRLLVPEIYTGDDIDISQANRVYSPRECMTADQRIAVPKKGIPAISEDLGQLTYQYYDNFTTSDGTIIKRYKEAKNAAGQFVRLCTAEGYYLAFRDSVSRNNYFDLKTMLREHIEYESLPAAPLLVPNYETVNESPLQEELNKHTYSIVKHMQFEGVDPELHVYNNAEKTMLEYLLRNRQRGFYLWPVQSNFTGVEFYNGTTWDENLTAPSAFTADDEANYDETTQDITMFDFFLLKDYVESNEGKFDINYIKLSDRFEPFALNISVTSMEKPKKEDLRSGDMWWGRPGYTTKTFIVIKDKKTNSLPVKAKDNITINCSVPFVFANGFTSYFNMLFKFNDEVGHRDELLDYEDGQTLNGIYIPSKGYGGSVYNESWDTIRPEENDYQAFEYKRDGDLIKNVLMKNVNGEYIYLTDKDGNKMNSRRGLFWMEPGISSVPISWHKLISKENTVRMYYDYENPPTEYKMWKVPETPIKVYQPKSTVYFNGHYVATNTPPPATSKESQDPLTIGTDAQMILTVLKIIKAGVEQSYRRNEFDIKFLDYKSDPLVLPADMHLFYDWDNTQLKLLAPPNHFEGTLLEELTNDKSWQRIKKDKLAAIDIREDMIKMIITDLKTDQHYEHIIYTNTIDMEEGLVLKINPISYYNKEKIIGQTNIDLEIDARSFIKNAWKDNLMGDQSVHIFKSLDSNIIINNFEVADISYKDNDGNHPIYYLPINPVIKMLNQGWPESYINLDDKDDIQIDVRELNLEVLYDRDWLTAAEYAAVSIQGAEGTINNYIRYQIYSGDQLMTTLEDDNILSSKTWIPADETMQVLLKGDVYLYVQLRQLTATEEATAVFANFTKYIFEPVKLTAYEALNAQGEMAPNPAYLGHPGDVFYDENEGWNESGVANIDKFKFTVNFIHTSRVLVANLYGNVIFNKPAYHNFKELVDIKELIIEYPQRKIVDTYDRKKQNQEIIEIADNLSSFKLKSLYPALDDGKHFLKFKILPLQTIYPTIRYLNNPDYIAEVDINEKELYGFDRVFINPNAYPNPPILYNNKLYDVEGKDYYYPNTWKNKDDYDVFMCDVQGRFVKPSVSNGKIRYLFLGDDIGDCRQDIYGTTDPRFNMPEPIYKTSVEWYRDKFYIKGKETNPFILNIQVKDEFDKITQKFMNALILSQPVKFGDNIIYEPVADNYLTDIIPNIEYRTVFKIDESTGKEQYQLVQNYEQNVINYTTGEIGFIIKGPGEKYHFTDWMFLYGIRYKNQFSTKGDYMKYWTGECLLENRILLNFIINTRENLADKRNRDSAIVNITEMGIFDQYGNLAAYMTHPIVQYRSDIQHISYSCLIEEPD
jgi:hypothetical protein